MFKIFELVQIFAPTNEIILLTGETGTGKDLLVKKIHELSPRNKKPFVAVNLLSFSPALFESELFGNTKGAFTGSVSEKKGFFEAADGGTIFLDEIGELPLELQGKLLRVIQYGEIYKLGDSNPLLLDIRIIAATNKDLRKAVFRNEFRADLFYRLNRGMIQLPPLRERKVDISLLVQHFLKTGNLMYNKKIAGISDKAMMQLLNYDFPGNIRELENIILNSAAITDDGNFIEEFMLPSSINKPVNNNLSELKLISIKNAERNHVLAIFSYCNGNYTKAASILGISERTLQRKIHDYKYIDL